MYSLTFCFYDGGVDTFHVSQQNSESGPLCNPDMEWSARMAGDRHPPFGHMCAHCKKLLEIMVAEHVKNLEPTIQ